MDLLLVRRDDGSGNAVLGVLLRRIYLVVKYGRDQMLISTRDLRKFPDTAENHVIRC